MKRRHRVFHRLLWPLLLVAAVSLITAAINHRPDYPSVVDPQADQN